MGLTPFQAVLTLNLMRLSRINPKLSAWEQLYGVYDFNATPIAPPGTKAIEYDTLTNRPTWAVHGTMGWYIAPSIKYYRYSIIYCPKTRALRISDTVTLFPAHCNKPKYNSEEEWIRATHNFTTHLENNKNNIPLPIYSNKQLEAV